MTMIPTSILAIWARGLLALGVVGGGLYMARAWYQRVWVYDPQREHATFVLNLGVNTQTALLLAVIVVLVWAVAGSAIIGWVIPLLRRPRPGDHPLRESPEGETHRLRQPDGSELHVVCYGPRDGPPLVLTTGLGATHTEWAYLRTQLATHFRLITWDLSGLGQSPRPCNNDYHMAALAYNLNTVLGLAGDRPAILLGHSIGGMIMLEFCTRFPEALGTRVAGLGLVHTTFTNPVRTTKHARVYTALERPLLVPLMHLTIRLWPLMWLMSWLSYLNGTAHLSMKLGGFASTATWDQVAFMTRFQPYAPPDVLARSMGMLAYDATATLATIAIPTLIVVGDRDTTCLPSSGAHMCAAMPGAQLVRLALAKHMGLVEHHEEFAAHVSAFANHCFAVVTGQALHHQAQNSTDTVNVSL